MTHWLKSQAPRYVSAIEDGNWTQILDERQIKEVELSEVYAKDFHHGTTGHNQLM